MAKKSEEMNSLQFKSLLGYLVTAAMAYISGKGYLPADVASEAGAWIIAGLPILYQIYKSRDAGRLAEAAKVSNVQIVAPDAIANSVPHDNVVPASENKVVSK